MRSEHAFVVVLWLVHVPRKGMVCSPVTVPMPQARLLKAGVSALIGEGAPKVDAP